MTIDYSQSTIKPFTIYPVVQPGMKVNDSNSLLMINAHFDGVLWTKFFLKFKADYVGLDDG